jgi:glutamate-ammonia-ligase adenylyltransferase
MGYASDIELILIYSDAGLTSGPDSISNARFFDQLVAAVATGISARQDGIFHVDLRMRPFGNAGSAAVLLSDFSSYYRSDGPAWPYERQAMVKFRCVSGDPEFSRRVTEICHEAIYSVGTFDFASMRAMRERQIRQLVRGGTINAKLSDGGLVDCEYAVQALQLTFGGDLPLLRHPNTRQVLRTAARLSLISPEQQSRIEDAYVFLRQLIDCLRMVRGNARDLTVPDSGTADYEQLGRRLESIHDSQITLQDLEHQMQIVREFSKSVEQHCRALRLGRGQK